MVAQECAYFRKTTYFYQTTCFQDPLKVCLQSINGLPVKSGTGMLRSKGFIYVAHFILILRDFYVLAAFYAMCHTAAIEEKIPALYLG